MSSYSKGRRFEYRVRDLFKSKGYVVIRAARSTPVDLVCLKDGCSVLVECKTKKSSLREKGKEKMLELAEKSKAIPVLAYREKRKVSLLDIRTNGSFSIS